MLDIDVIGTVHENLRKGRIDREQNRIAKVLNSVQTDPYRYKWTLNQGNFCNAYYSDLKYLIVVHSATGNFDRRRMLRRIYGLQFYETHRCAILFVLGQPTEKSVQKRIHKEAYQYKDIIQQDFVDSYRNLTWKALAWLRFVDERCKRVKFIIKIDDDVIFNIFTVIDFLKSIESTQKDEVEPRIICRVIRNRKIGRKRGNKWFVSTREVTGEYYLPYCVGMAIIFPSGIVQRLLNASIGEPYFWIDDYFITGILANKINAQFMDIKKQDVVVYSHEGSVQNFISGRIFFRLFSDLSHAERAWQALQKTHLLKENHATVALQSSTLTDISLPS